MVRQEFIPGGVDEAQFEMNVTAPEGASPAAMNEAMPAIERDVRAVPGVQLALTHPDGPSPAIAVRPGGAGVQDGRRTEHRMTGEVELLFGGEDAALGPVVLDVEQEDRLELPQLLGDPEHQLRRERARTARRPARCRPGLGR